MPINTQRLKKFAPEARRRLHELVRTKINYVLNMDSPELREKTASIEQLKKQIAQKGKEAVVEQVAYTWFNRFVALRYMDVRGFQPLGIRIISPEEGGSTPEILGNAMAGQLPDDLISVRDKVIGLLSGSIGSNKPQNEAYSILLIAACNHLHRIFPFLFEKIDDYTELLLPDDLTTDHSILKTIREGMTEEDCREVEVLGWIYQFYIAEKKDEVFASKGTVKKEEIPAATQLFTPRWIVEYMVQNTVGKLWVLNHPNSSLKEHMPYYIESEVTAEDVLTIYKPEELTLLDQACGSGHILVYGFEMLYKIYEEEGYAPSDIPRLIIEHNLHGFEIDERAAQLAGLAILMKAREYQRRLFRKSDVPEPKITCFKDLLLSDEEINATLKKVEVESSEELIHDLRNMQQATNLGSLILPHSPVQEFQKAIEVCERSKYTTELFDKEKIEQIMVAFTTLGKLGAKYCCVVDNPPYMGSGNMNKILSDFVREKYPDSKSDLMASFMECGLKYLKKCGFLGMINQHTWMFNSSYEELREKLIDNVYIESLVHLGPNTFPEIKGEVVQSVTFSILNNFLKRKGTYIRLVEFNDSQTKREQLEETIYDNRKDTYFTAQQVDFRRIKGCPLAYFLNEKSIAAINKSDRISDICEVRKGLSTGKNDRFLKSWYEVEFENILFSANSYINGFKWIPANKGGGYKKYFGNLFEVLNWKNNGEELTDFKPKSVIRSHHHFFKKVLAFSKVSTSNFCLRFFDEGFIPIDASSYFVDYNDKYERYILGVFNSKVFQFLFSKLLPTQNNEVGDISKFPISVQSDYVSTIDPLVETCVSITIFDWNSRETSWDFKQNELIRSKKNGHIENLSKAYDHFKLYWQNKFYQLHQNEEELNRQFIEIYGLEGELTPDVPLNEITILQEELDSKKLAKVGKTYANQKDRSLKPDLPFKDAEVMAQFISYAVGCMVGRYCLDKEGLVLANQGETLEDYLTKIERIRDQVSFLPDELNIIPVLDDEWFTDDIVNRFYSFLKASFGEENFIKNLSFVEECLGKDIRKYFIKDFYKDHVRRYKKRPIYWLFSSPKGHFSVLIYMHRYTTDTLSHILHHYLRPFMQKLEGRITYCKNMEIHGSDREKRDSKRELSQLEAVLEDCRQYDRDILYPLASERISIDLDDGVLVNYNKFGAAVEEVKGLNDKKKKEAVRNFDWIDTSSIR